MPFLPLLGLGALLTVANKKSKSKKRSAPKQRCKGKRPDGRACNSFAMHGEGYCRSHLNDGLFFRTRK